MPRGERLTRQEWETLKVQDFERLEAENGRLRSQVRIAEGCLEHIVQIADRGADASQIGVYAHDALIRMSVME